MKSIKSLNESEEEQKREKQKQKQIREKEEREAKLKKIVDINGFKYIRKIGEGAYGAVIEVEQNKKIFAVKIILYEGKRGLQTEDVNSFRGKKIVKIIKEIKPEKNKENNTYDENDYYLYVMECSFIGSLYNFHKFINNKLIYQQPFVENI